MGRVVGILVGREVGVTVGWLVSPEWVGAGVEVGAAEGFLVLCDGALVGPINCVETRVERKVLIGHIDDKQTNMMCV